MKLGNSKAKTAKRRFGVTIVIENPTEPAPPVVGDIEMFSREVRRLSEPRPS